MLVFLIFGIVIHVVFAGSNLPLLSGTLRTFQVHACDGHELRVECWPGTLISIYLAQYGRQVPSHQLCPPDPPSAAPSNDSTDCRAPHALTTVEEACREQRVCKVQTSPLTFGSDPCPGVRKYAEVAYKCRPNVFSNRVVCEGERLRLRCHKNLRIVIYSAAFGATHYGVPECPQPDGEANIEDCQVSYATEAVMSSCHGRRKCSLGADVGTFGKPSCPEGTRLFLKVVHTCVPKEILKELDIGGGSSEENKDQDDSDYTGFIEEPRYVPTPTHKAPTEETKEVQQTTVKTDMQSDENSGEEVAGDPSDPDHRVVGFLSEWFSAFNFLKDNKEKFALYLTLSISLALLAVLAAVAAKFYFSRRRNNNHHPPPPKKKPPLPTDDSGGISPFEAPLQHFGEDGGRFSSLRRALRDDDCSCPRAAPDNSFYYS